MKMQQLNNCTYHPHSFKIKRVCSGTTVCLSSLLNSFIPISIICIATRYSVSDIAGYWLLYTVCLCHAYFIKDFLINEFHFSKIT